MSRPPHLLVTVIEQMIGLALSLENAAEDVGNANPLFWKILELSDHFKQVAISMVDAFYDIPQEHADGEPVYDPNSKSEGDAVASPDGKVSVTIGDPAFTWTDKDGNTQPSAAWLASTKVHELCGHGELVTADGRWAPGVGIAEREVIAYNKELEWSGDTGLTDAMVEEIETRKKEYADKMPVDRQSE